MKGSFTLIELVIVIVILGILASLGVPIYTKAIEKAKCQEAVAMLKIIQSAEKVRKLETGSFVNCADTADCNTALNLALSGDNWAYNVTGASASDFTAQADRAGGAWDNCQYTINSTATTTTNVVSVCLYDE